MGHNDFDPLPILYSIDSFAQSPKTGLAGRGGDACDSTQGAMSQLAAERGLTPVLEHKTDDVLPF